MNKFKVGDTVRCVRGDSPRKRGDVRVVEGIISDEVFLCGGAVADRGSIMFAARWELVSEAPPPPADDLVHQPHHYARYVIEPATFIAANKLPFDVGNIVKYTLRYDAKNGREDILKARRYCDMLLERVDREARVASGEAATDVWKAML